MKKLAILLLTLVCSAASARAYTRITGGGGATPKWPAMPVSYWINELGSPQISNGSDFNAIHAAFRAWQDIPTADITFNYGGTTPVHTAGRDGVNLVTFSDDSLALGTSTIAATLSWFGSSVNGTMVTQEADIVFTNAVQFSTSGETEKFDIQGVLTHEVGHLLGLDHSALVSSVMGPFAAISQTYQRTLLYDDIAGVSEIYPRADPAEAGAIAGRVLLNGSSIFGAHVVAVDHDGTPLVSALSQRDGSYSLRFLPPGAYKVYAEPLDLPVSEQNVGGPWYRNLRTDFGTTYFGGVAGYTEAPAVSVTAQATAAADISVLARSSTNLNLTRPSSALRIARGTSEILRIGGEDITAGISITASNASLVLGPPGFGGRISSSAPTSAEMQLFVPAAMPLGPKNIAVSRGGSTSILTGTFVVTEVAPANLEVLPDSGGADGGAAVTITGVNFRPGAQVFFGGLPAQDVRVVDSGTILATTPESVDVDAAGTRNLIPGAVNLQVFNSDGTSGIAVNGFTYAAPHPSITRISPLAGPPTTPVTIEGARFDSRIQNVEVRFNGVLARTLAATANSIQTIVPFGATAGPVTVSVFGQSAIGPDFAVTVAPPSSNVAGLTYNFIDATPSSGGTNLSFTGQSDCGVDDAVAFVTLPINFSLFRDIYPAGARITISTNGWLSMETTPFTAFQNSRLPATSVTSPGGSPQTVPPSLIAPYWDDLCHKRGVSSVSTRTLGETPNRQFVIQWSKMTILDEFGSDLNAEITFEAILFEGSNDIQFVYQSLNGPFSDGSRATIGAQDLKRTTAMLSGFDQPVLRSSHFITYRFRDGGYSAIAADATAPSRPVVSDGGAVTASRTELTASWTSEDAESGIRDYEYAIGRTPGGVEVRPFVATTQNAVVVGGLNLDAGATYYFAVRATNNAMLTSEIGLSNGIRIDPAYRPEIRIIPSLPHNSSEFGGIALLAPAAMSVVLRALDSNGAVIAGTGIRNPVTIDLAARQQYSRILSELFGLQTFDGWIEIEAPAPGLGVYSATGAWNMTHLDGNIASEPLTDFMLFHGGSSAVLVNPSGSAATVTMDGAQPFVIPPRSRVVVPIPGTVRVRSSQALAAVERMTRPGKLAVSSPAAIRAAAASIVFPHAVAGGGYTSTVRLANVGNAARLVRIGFAGLSADVPVNANSTAEISLGQLLNLDESIMRTGAVRITQQRDVFGSGTPSLLGVLDIENGTGLLTLAARPPSTDVSFGHIAHGNGLFTGLALAAGDRAANVVIEVYEPAGGAPRTGTLHLGANQQVAKLLSDFVQGVGVQLGGYIKIRSDQPVWCWEIYGSGEVMASAPPL